MPRPTRSVRRWRDAIEALSHAQQEKVPFGEDLHVPLEGRTLVISTDEFPKDPA
ncbi:hypothetical protein [Kitasatospora sp. HPMI-4]|uniref:hypothetical protein n=1 Tax=Kitasatospora sp. HPMI-4 TaxID=3448443 RepID=UPI003F1C7601